ncbi:MAG: hypothetical protein M3068_04090 [Gemmatimonadota bacterium]|nr:hypothetical protein [Gemmatimonadota bacterium]
MPTAPRRPLAPGSAYVYRRPLVFRELLPAIAAGAGAGLFAFYIARLFLERTPLDRAPITRRAPPLGARSPARGARG